MEKTLCGLGSSATGQEIEAQQPVSGAALSVRMSGIGGI